MKRMPSRNQLVSLLVPTDFSAGARLALERAVRLPLARGGRIHLLHVLPAAAPLASRTSARRALSRAAALIARPTAAAGTAAPTVVKKVLMGNPYVEIIRYTRETDSDLIVLGAKGAGATIRKTIGTTAVRVLRMSDAPVLVVKRKAAGGYQRPMIALPADPSARRLIALTGRVLQDNSVPIRAVRAYALPFAGFIDYGTLSVPSGNLRELSDAARRSLDVQVSELEGLGFRIRPILRQGDARMVIGAEAARSKADLVALGTHARSGIAHVLLGSVAEWATVNVACDVLIARPVRFTFEAP